MLLVIKTISTFSIEPSDRCWSGLKGFPPISQTSPAANFPKAPLFLLIISDAVSACNA